MSQKLRLMCPSCSAQYEVDESVIPADGRDVQCSNCDHTWWQTRESALSAEDAAEMDRRGAYLSRGAAGEAAAAERADADGYAEEDAGDGEAAPGAWPAPAESAPPTGPGDRAASEPAPAERESARGAETPPAAAPAAAMAAGPGSALAAATRKLDESVVGVLREEAERETAARRDETAPATARPAAVRPAASEAARQAAEGASTRPERPAARAERDPHGRERSPRLPDVEDINSTLGSRRAGPGPSAGLAEERARRRSFRVGFFATLLLIFLLFGLYLYSAEIVAAVPQAEPAMTAYLTAVESLRLWLEGLAMRAAEAINGMTQPD